MTRVAGSPIGSSPDRVTTLPWCIEDLSTYNPDWEDYASAPLLEQWAEELTAAVAAPDEFAQELWTMAGSRIVLVGDDRTWNALMLRAVAAYTGIRFAEVKDVEVSALAELSALVDPNTHAPLLLHVQGGEWLQTAEPSDGEAGARAALHNQLATLLDGFTPEAPLVVVVSVRELTDLPERLRMHTFDRVIQIEPLTMRDRGELFLHAVGSDQCSDALRKATGKVGIIVRDYFEDERLSEFASASLRRTALRENRLLELRDLLKLAATGVGERVTVDHTSPEQRHNTAVHEAGHAVVAIRDSNGTHIPECIVLCDTEDYCGLMINDVELSESASSIGYTLQWLRHRVRILLGGRAAEELLLGTEKVSSGASDDLYRATKLILRAITQHGLALNTDTPSDAAGALLVVRHPESDEWIFPSTVERVEETIRRALAREYEGVRALLAANRALLIDVTSRLEQDTLVMQEQLREIADAHGVGRSGHDLNVAHGVPFDAPLVAQAA